MGVTPTLGSYRCKVLKKGSNFHQETSIAGAMKQQAGTTSGDRLLLGQFVLDLGAGELLTADGGLAGLRRRALDVLLLLDTRPRQW